ncbi:Retrovirus-related Pol polyprotein from transposon TNT 1-94 [Vitis vinifera]|uniref:Retrovirus-related Pol polyprotein from transposon TNT 1-94 n=1 Tax=Vitis vinifera TaxID=29760 RepID=A0A438CBB8_VITVI|nr:Retrovirus-related Pol polyprotein from transposon TNT 1-94 [Vitis vinifera]
MELKSWIFFRYGSLTAINHPKTSPNIDKSTFKCTHCNKTDPTSLDIPQFQSNDFLYDQENNEEPRDSKKTSTTTVAEIKTEANVVEKASALVAAIDYGAPIIGEGSLTLTDTLNLDSILVVPSLDYNLLMTWLCFMKTKDEVNLLFQNFHKMIETQYNAKTTCSNTPQQNGVVKQKNRHLLEVVRASLIAAKISISYWGEAITSAAYLINRVLSNLIDFQTPLQALLILVAPTVTNLPPRVFGCVAFVHLHKHQRTKLTSHALQCVFVGYALHKKGYRCYHPPTRRMFITMDVVFHEDSMYFSSESELQGEYHKEIQTLDYDYHISKEDESGQSELVNQEAGELDMSGTTLELSSNDHPKAEEVIEEGRDSTIEPFEQFGSEDAFIEIPNQSSSVEGVLNLEPDPFMKQLPHRHNKAIPNSVQEALADPRWKAAMNEEMKSLQKNETWELVECPLGNKPIGCRWIICEETGMSGCQPVNTPIEKGLKLCVEPNQVSTDKERYQRLVGILMYLAHTRPDLAYALSVVSQYMHNPGEQHMNAVMLDDKRSTSGYFTFVGGNLVTWKSKKWNIVARSSVEAEFRGYLFRQPIRLFCDNKVACDIAHNPIQHDRTKHVEVDRFFIKEKLDDKIVELPKIRSKDQLAISSPKLSQVKCSQTF